jgi:hypothetical protein
MAGVGGDGVGAPRRFRLTWDMVLIVAFVPGAAWSVLVSIIAPATIGSHGAIYADAARAWLTGADPWQVGPPAAIFGGPPPMLLPFAPFAFLPWDVTRLAWVAIDSIVAIWAIRRLGLPPYWLAFPPLFEAIVLGHPEVLVLALVVLRRPLGGLAVLIKPYAVLPFLAERRWRAVIVGAVAAAITFPFLPWGRFFAELPQIGATLARQSQGDSAFGEPLLMLVAILALAALGPRRALWLAVPVLWPYAQPIYKTMSIPVMPPLLAFFWAIPGLALVGVVVLAVLTLVERRRALPTWLQAGIRPASNAFEPIGPAANGEVVGAGMAAMQTGAA